MTDSTTAGVLPVVTPPAPTEGSLLTDFFQQVVSQLTGVTSNNVRPRWQQNPPNMPSIGTDWAALGITDRQGDAYAYEGHNPTASAGDGANVVYRHETMELLTSFYGPNADKNADLLREGLSVAQNREQLTTAGMGLVRVGRITTAPAFLQQQWQYRIDMPVTFRRGILRKYAVLSLTSLQGTVTTDTGLTETISAP